MTTRWRLQVPVLLLLCAAPTGAEAQVDPQLAQVYFEEARTL